MSRGVVDLRKKKSGISEGRTNIQISFPERRRSPLRARRRRLRALAALAVLVLLSGAVAGVSALSYIPEYSISAVAVSGAKTVSPKLIRAYAETLLDDGSNPLISRKNIFFYPREEIEKGIPERFPRIESAKISRESMLAQAIAVEVTERKQFALWCRNEQCFMMDDGGFIFAASGTSTAGSALIFRGGIDEKENPVGQAFLPERLRGLLSLFDRLREAGFAPMGATVENEEDFAVSFSEGFLMRASFAEDTPALVRNLQLALSAEPLRGKVNKLEYVDLRFGGQAYYKNRQ